MHITQNTTTITTARMGARLERARTSPPLRTMTERVHQHHCTRTLTASSSIGVHVCHGTTHKDEAQPPAAHEHAHAQQSKSVKPYHERALMATASEPTSAGTCAHEAAAMAQRCARVSPHAPGIRAVPLGARREAGDHPVPSRRLRSSGKKESLRPRMREPAMGVRLAPGERARTLPPLRPRGDTETQRPSAAQ